MIQLNRQISYEQFKDFEKSLKIIDIIKTNKLSFFITEAIKVFKTQ